MAALCNFFFTFILQLSLLACFSLSTPTQQTLNLPKTPKSPSPKSPKPSTNFPHSLSFPIVSLSLSSNSSTFLHSLSSTTSKPQNPSLKSPFKYTMALLVSLLVGTPPQTQQMVLDTGSQLSWIQCKTTIKAPSFDPSLSSSFSILPCNTSLCKPQIPDFTLPTFCDQNRRCHYSYFYADGTLAEGDLAREIIGFENYLGNTIPPQIIGCASNSAAETPGLLGLNLGRLSFTSQAKTPKFSYCIPDRKLTPNSLGTFVLGENPDSGRLSFSYVNLINLRGNSNQNLPYFDKAAYTLAMEGIEVGGKRLNVSRSVFLPDAAGAGQTMVDSGTEFTFLVEEAHVKLKQEFEMQVRSLVKDKVKRGYVYGGGLDLCYDLGRMSVGEKVGFWGGLPEVVFVMAGGVKVKMGKERVVAQISEGVGCFSFGSSMLLGVESNIIGNYHQQNMWVEYDLSNSRVGFAPADCSRGR